ncbi:3-ketoacyl-CoA synthase 17 [Oryza sativa Japonica Group]|uniref:3-ketoacyl-CoA synthase n=2 Tax=Oryza sativa subsp. japonica TaxID=39947 RepID=A0A0P0XMG8_ORYSJ|nr:3-ketoacyl-CoA synthase 17 [Oryza sativa Japonica Group]BAD23320.1 putative FAE1 [Oryza sativa Japonica Group]BAF24892.1 Os09g0360500 [Oryza sativa Japonica Group]BAT07688.1 Os09g0360500 [Oryza sativa Japonica Group]|eukprot:NP_001062978.1 Os09g0360500 [Oryza sativa Japonica Group]
MAATTTTMSSSMAASLVTSLRSLSAHALVPLVASALLFVVAVVLRRRRRPVYLLNYSCHLPDVDRKVNLEVCEYFGQRCRHYSDDTADFMRLIYRKSGLGQETYAPPFIFSGEFQKTQAFAVQEAEEGLFATVAHLLAKSDVRPRDVGFVVVACSMFSPAPSLASMIVRRFGMPPGTRTYSLAGMGCSAGTVGIDMAARALRVSRRGGYALVVVTENMSLNWYFGENKHMLVTNCIFRVGSAAALVTDVAARRGDAKYELVRTLRTHHGGDDAAYNAAVQMEDEEGNVGVALTKDLVRVAGAGLRQHIATLAPHVLPVSELLRYVWRVARAYVAGNPKAVAAIVPDFQRAFEHMCIHSGGKAVIDAVVKLMAFGPQVVEPARATLHRFGNTSSSLVFYELAYFEAKRRVRAGDRLWMLAFGTGFKACSNVWRALRDSAPDADNPWNACAHRYPAALPPPSTRRSSGGAPAMDFTHLKNDKLP